MSGYRNFAVAGTGEIGTPIIEELLAQKKEGLIDKVVVLTRQPTIPAHLLILGATPHTTTYTSPSSLTTALHGIDVLLVCVTVTPSALAIQIPLAAAAKAAGVSLFVPSEFGAPTRDKSSSGDGMWKLKDDIRVYLERIKLPYAQFFNGAFIDWFLVDRPGDGAFDWENGKVVIKGSGEVKVSWTGVRDVARYVVRCLLTLPSEELKNRKVFKMEAERKTLKEVVEEYCRRTGRIVDVRYETREFLERQVKEYPDDWENGRVRWLYLMMERGDVVVAREGDEVEMGEVNREWPKEEWKPKGCVDLILERWG